VSRSDRGREAPGARADTPAPQADNGLHLGEGRGNGDGLGHLHAERDPDRVEQTRARLDARSGA
jgi:hypothetical protein